MFVNKEGKSLMKHLLCLSFLYKLGVFQCGDLFLFSFVTLQVSEDLSSELATVRAFYERALEQLSASENNKRLQQQHLDLAQQEARRLQQEVDRLSQVSNSDSL